MGCTGDTTPDDCSESETEDFTISLAASNYCWQDLAAVDVTAELITVDASVGATYLSDYDAGSNPADPTAKTAFSNGDSITGLIIVSSTQVETSDVTITAVDKEHFSDDQYTVSVNSYDLINTATLENRASFASF